MIEPEILGAALAMISAHYAQIEGAVADLYDRTLISLADGSFLDEHGRERGQLRHVDEADEQLRVRVRGIEDQVTRSAILIGVNNVLLTGQAAMEEARRDGMFASAGPVINKRQFAGIGSAYESRPAFQLFIPDQAAEPRHTAFAAPTSGLADSRAFAYPSATLGSYPQAGMYAEPVGRVASAIYALIYREVERLTAAGVSFQVTIR